jgi:hypothetical protein
LLDKYAPDAKAFVAERNADPNPILRACGLTQARVRELLKTPARRATLGRIADVMNPVNDLKLLRKWRAALLEDRIRSQQDLLQVGGERLRSIAYSYFRTVKPSIEEVDRSIEMVTASAKRKGLL